jgi:hypothetical protein
MSLMKWLLGKPQASKNVAVLRSGPAPTGINKVRRMVAVDSKAEEPNIEEDRDRFVLGQTLIDTLIPHARNPAPFSTHELRYFTNQWIVAISEDDLSGEMKN